MEIDLVQPKLPDPSRNGLANGHAAEPAPVLLRRQVDPYFAAPSFAIEMLEASVADVQAPAIVNREEALRSIMSHTFKPFTVGKGGDIAREEEWVR
jgi:hypothetical protein